jgi:hypothetical protein
MRSAYIFSVFLSAAMATASSPFAENKTEENISGENLAELFSNSSPVPSRFPIQSFLGPYNPAIRNPGLVPGKYYQGLFPPNPGDNSSDPVLMVRGPDNKFCVAYDIIVQSNNPESPSDFTIKAKLRPAEHADFRRVLVASGQIIAPGLNSIASYNQNPVLDKFNAVSLQEFNDGLFGSDLTKSERKEMRKKIIENRDLPSNYTLYVPARDVVRISSDTVQYSICPQPYTDPRALKDCIPTYPIAATNFIFSDENGQPTVIADGYSTSGNPVAALFISMQTGVSVYGACNDEQTVNYLKKKGHETVVVEIVGFAHTNPSESLFNFLQSAANLNFYSFPTNFAYSTETTIVLPARPDTP